MSAAVACKKGTEDLHTADSSSKRSCFWNRGRFFFGEGFVAVVEELLWLLWLVWLLATTLPPARPPLGPVPSLALPPSRPGLAAATAGVMGLRRRSAAVRERVKRGRGVPGDLATAPLLAGSASGLAGPLPPLALPPWQPEPATAAAVLAGRSRVKERVMRAGSVSAASAPPPALPPSRSGVATAGEASSPCSSGAAARSARNGRHGVRAARAGGVAGSCTSGVAVAAVAASLDGELLLVATSPDATHIRRKRRRGLWALRPPSAL